MHLSSLNLWHHLPRVELLILKTGNYQQNCNDMLKNQSEKKTKNKYKYKKQKVNATLKLRSLGFILDIDVLIGLFIFSVVNNQRKSRYQRWKICLKQHCSQKVWSRTTQRRTQFMIMMSKQAMDLMYFLMIIFTLCQSYKPKNGSCSLLLILHRFWRLNLGTPKMVQLKS